MTSDNNELWRNLKIVDKLNQLFFIDPELTKNLVNTRYPCNQAYEHSEFVCSDEGVGLIGVLSGLILDTAHFRFAADYDLNNQLQGFKLLQIINNQFVEVK
jgi:hypothetical protein